MEKLIHEGFVTLKEVDVEIKGKKRIYDEICVKDAVSAILIDEDGKLGIVRQYRPFVDEETRELLAETLDKEGLSDKETLIAGLLEEAEISEDQIISISESPIFRFYMMVGCSKSVMTIYEIHVTKQETKKVNDQDVDMIEWLTLEEVKDLIDRKEIKDQKIALSYYYLISKDKK